MLLRILLGPGLLLLLPILARLWLPTGACGSQRQTARVNENPMSEWSRWSDCSAICGSGQRTRSRVGILLPEEKEAQTQACEVNCVDVYEWSVWQAWSNCSLTCGSQGIRSRFRQCLKRSQPMGAAVAGAAAGAAFDAVAAAAPASLPTVDALPTMCSGDPESWMATEACNQFDCPRIYQWTRWSEWSACTLTCSSSDSASSAGRQSRSRQCLDAESLAPATPADCGGSGSGGAEETRTCNQGIPCPSLPDWQPWSTWSPCPVTCGPGQVTRNRERHCPTDQQQRAASACIQPVVTMETQWQDCGNADCPPVHGGWGDWRPWSNCLSTCGWGSRLRNRLCNNPSPSNGGADCSGASASYERCLGGTCPVDGQWGVWSPSCPNEIAGCGTVPRGLCAAGKAMYCRQCDSPKPDFGGSPCVTGLAKEERDCWNVEACNNGVVQPPMNFSIIGFLNATDLLVTWRRAPYGLEASSFFLTWSVSGTDVTGDADVPAVARSQRETLGEGYSRWIRNLAPQSLVDVTIATRSVASGALQISEPLRRSFQVSRVDGAWGAWSYYTACSPTGDCNIPGTRQRTRSCNNPPPTNGGLACPGSAVQVSRCFHPC